MESTLTRHDWEEYLIRLYFGNKCDLLTLCINRAYRDLNRTLHGIDRYKGKHELSNSATNNIRSIFKGIKEGHSKPKTYEEFDKWHEINCRKLKNLYEENGFMNFTVGQAQKWINMTFKYIFCMGENRLPGYSDLYEFCHVPIDNIILDNISQCGAPIISCPWSRLDDYSEYLSFQIWFRERFDLPPLDVEFKLWLKGVSPPDNVITPVTIPIPPKMMGITEENESPLGPYQRNRIVLCSADAGPNSQKKVSCEAAYFFPGAKWVGAVRNAAHDLKCRFVILTTAHGMVNPHDIIGPYDLKVENNIEQVSVIWRNTVPQILGINSFDLLLFYSGGVPREPYMELFQPILRDLKIDFLTFGRPMMFDSGKIKVVAELLENRSSMNELRSVLRCPERLTFVPWEDNRLVMEVFPMPIFKLILHKAYYNQGFFNIPVDYDRYISKNESPVELRIGGGRIFNGWINRSANLNGTARIMGKTSLRDFFRSHYKQGDTVNMKILSQNSIEIQN